MKKYVKKIMGTALSITMMVLLMGCFILVDVKANSTTKTVDKQLFPTILTEYSYDTLKDMNEVSLPFVYQNQDLFSGKTISKIGVPVASVDDENPYISLYVVEQYTFRSGKKVDVEDLGEAIKANFGDLSAEQEVNGWVYATLADPIEIEENETLAIGNVSDPITWQYAETLVNPNYKFWDTTGTDNGMEKGIVLDICYQEEVTENTLPYELAGKKISILGDSISTYNGVSNVASLGLDKQQPWYTSVTDGDALKADITEYDMTSVNDTWWGQVISNNNMTLLKNNSWSGAHTRSGRNAGGESGSDPVSSGIIRASNLHIGEGEERVDPDVIAVFLGANDFLREREDYGHDVSKFSVSDYVAAGTDITDDTSSDFTAAYYAMTKKLKDNYPGAEIYLFTVLPHGYRGKTDSSNLMGYTEEQWYDRITEYNSVIRGVAEYNDTDNLHLVDLSAGVDGEFMDEDNTWKYLGNGQLYDKKATHPNIYGMNYICKVFEDKLEKTWIGEQPEYKFEDYRKEEDKDANGNYTKFPCREGYVFGGWYTDETYTEAAPQNQTTGNYVPKWIDRDVLTVQVQLRRNTELDPGGSNRVTYKTKGADLRLTTSVDSLNYQKIGFKVKGDTEKTYTTKKVYEELSAYQYKDDTGTEQGYKAWQIFCESSEYFMTQIIKGFENNVPNKESKVFGHYADDDFGETITVTPQWTTLDGTLVSGRTRAFEINDGVGYVAEIDALNGTGVADDHIWYTSLSGDPESETETQNAVQAAHSSEQSDNASIEIGILRPITLASAEETVTIKRNISIQNHAVKDVTLKRGTDFTMIQNDGTEGKALVIGGDREFESNGNKYNSPGIVIDGTLSSEATTPAIKNGDTAGQSCEITINENVTIQNAKRTLSVSIKGAGGLDNYGKATVSATFMDCQGAYGGAIYSLGGTNTLTFNGYIKDCTALCGGGINMGSGTLEMTGGLIEDCVVERAINPTSKVYDYGSGGGIFSTADATINFRDGAIQSCQAVKGGGIQVRKGTISGAIRDCHAIANTVDEDTQAPLGGGIYVMDAIVMDGTVEHCDAENGAGIYADKELTLQGNTFIQNCEASNYGGGVFAPINVEKLTLQDNATIQGCDAKRGGGIYQENSSNSPGNCTVTVQDNALIQLCNAEQGGGIAAANPTQFVMTGGMIRSCTSTEAGGGIHTRHATLSGGTIKGCEAANGAGVRLVNGEITGGTIVGCTATTSGGAVLVEGNGPSLTVKDANIMGCEATNGGGVYLGTSQKKDTNTSFSMTSGTIKSCNAVNGGGVFGDISTVVTCDGIANIQDCIATNGGGIHGADGSTLNFTNGTITKCSATNGGGIHGATGSTLNFTNGTITKCSAIEEGGGVCLANGTLSGTITNCKATRGGGILVKDWDTVDTENSTADVTLSGATITECTAQNGGAAYIRNGILDMKSGTIEQCTATANGGGVYAYAGSRKEDDIKYAANSKFVMSDTDGKIISCTATKNGGGVFGSVKTTETIDGSDVECATDVQLQAGTIESCTATENGAGVALGKGTLCGTIKSCTATGNGGGVYAVGDVGIQGNIQNCTAQNGAGIYAVSNDETETPLPENPLEITVNLEGATITECEAKIGGGIWGGKYASINLNTECSITECSGSKEDGGYAGGIFLYKGTIKGTIKNCSAYRGGAVCVRKNGTVTMKNATITECEAILNGGAFHLNPGSTFTMTCETDENGNPAVDAEGNVLVGSITSCKAGNVGGAIHSRGSKKVNLTYGKISDCEDNENVDGRNASVQLSLCGEVTCLHLGENFYIKNTTDCIRIWGTTEREDDVVLHVPEQFVHYNFGTENDDGDDTRLYIVVQLGTQQWVQPEQDVPTDLTVSSNWDSSTYPITYHYSVQNTDITEDTGAGDSIEGLTEDTETEVTE